MVGLDKSLFITSAPIEREVTLADGSKHVLHFRQLENTHFELFAMHQASADEGVASRAAARLLAAGVVDADGKPAMTPDQAVLLKRQVMQQLLTALLEVNGYGRQVAEEAKKP